MTDPKDYILDELTINRQYYKELIKPYTDARDKAIDEEDDLFYEIIIEDYKYTIISVITEDMAERLSLNVEDLLIVLEEVNLIKFFEPEN